MKKLLVAWQDPESRSWFPIGQLTRKGDLFQFVYLRGSLDAQNTTSFRGLASFPHLYQVYQSEELFPLFANRVLRPSRPDYLEYLTWLDQPSGKDPIALLARSGGQRGTDTLQVFSPPEAESSGVFSSHFFVHGVSHLPEASRRRAEQLQPGERLLVLHDFQNPKDPKASLLRTAEEKPGDVVTVGYCPRYLFGGGFEVMTKNADWPCVTVTRVNPPPAPLQFRVLCSMQMRCPDDFQPCSGRDYEPLVAATPEFAPLPA